MQETQILSTPSPAATATPKRALVFDACHAGVVLRAVLFVEAVAGVGAMFATETPAQWLAVLALLTGGVLPATLAWLLVACSLKVWLQRLSIAQQYTAGVLLGALAGLLAGAMLALVQPGSKRLRYFMQRDGAVLSMVLRIFLRVIAQSLQAHCIGAANADKESLHIGAVAFIHRFGSSLNEHVHFHVCVVDGVFEELVGEGSADAAMQVSASGVVFHPATGIDATPVAPVQTTLQKRILRAFVARGLL